MQRRHSQIAWFVIRFRTGSVCHFAQEACPVAKKADFEIASQIRWLFVSQMKTSVYGAGRGDVDFRDRRALTADQDCEDPASSFVASRRS